MTKKLKSLLQSKQKTISRDTGAPSQKSGKDGDFHVRRISGQGIFLFYKWGNKWYTARMSQYRPKTAEHKQPVKLPIGVEPANVGDLTITSDGNIKVKKGQAIKNQVLSINNSKTIDSDEVILSRNKDSGSANASDFMITNIGTGRSYLHIQTSAAAGDPYILLSYNVVGESPALKQWCIGMDNNDADLLHFLYKTSGTAPLTPSSTTANEHKMLLDTSGNLTTLGTITDGSGNTLGAADITGVTLTGDSGGTLSDTAGSADFTIAGGTNCSTAGSGSTMTVNVDAGAITALNSATANELVTVGATTTELDAEANLTFDGDHLSIAATGKIYFDGGNDTNIYESSADVLRIAVGGDIIMQLSEKGDDGNEVNFGSSCAGFTQLEPTYDATATTVDFRHSNKQFVTFGSGNITNIGLYFPLVSGNFVLLIKQDGTGSRTITNYKVYEFDETLADGSSAVKFAGGSNPTLTTDANHVDILSFYWDADNEIAYGVATLDFQF